MPPTETIGEIIDDAVERVLRGSAGATLPSIDSSIYGVTPDSENELWMFYERIPEAWWYVQFLGRNISNVRLLPARKKPGQSDPVPVGTQIHEGEDIEGDVRSGGDTGEIDGDGELVYENDTDARCAELVQQIDGPYGIGGLMQRSAELIAVVGKGYWVGHVEDVPIGPDGELLDDPEPGDESTTAPVIVEWEVLDRGELQRNPSNAKIWQIREKEVWIDLHPGTHIIPLIDPHPRRRGKAKSSFMAARDTLRRIVKLQAAQAAISDSRLATRGLLLIAQEWDIPAPPWWLEQGNEAKDWNVATWLHEAIIAPLQNRGHSSAVAPIVMEVPFEQLKDGFALIDFFTDFDKHLLDLIIQELKRVAVAWDVPTAIMSPEGVENMNHWNIFAVQESTEKTTWLPLSNLIIAPLVVHYIRKTLRDEGYNDWREMCIVPDTSGIMAKTNRTEDATKLFDKGLLSERETVIESGFDPEQMPSDDEWMRNWLRRMAESSASLDVIKLVLQVLGVELPELPETGDQPVPPGVEQEPEQEAPSEGGMPETAPDEITAGAGSIAQFHTNLKIVGLAESTAFEAVKRAGNVLRQQLPKELRAEMEDLQPWQVPSLLGADEVTRITEDLDNRTSIGFGVWSPQTFLRLHSQCRLIWSEEFADSMVAWVRGECERRMFDDLSEGVVLSARDVLARLPLMPAA